MAISENGRLLWSNRQRQAFLQGSKWLRMSDGQLCAREADRNLTLQHAMRNVLATGGAFDSGVARRQRFAWFNVIRCRTLRAHLTEQPPMLP